MTLPSPTPRPSLHDQAGRTASRAARDLRAEQDARSLCLVTRGDRDAYEALYRRYAPGVRTIARRVLAGGADTEDVVQVTFLAVWQHAHRYDLQRGAVSTWIYTLAQHKAVDAVRQEDQHRRRRAGRDHLDEAVGSDAGPDELALRADSAATVRAALTQLDAKHRDTLTRAYFGDRSLRQVAVDMDVPEGTAKGRSRAGLQQLRILLAGVA